MRTSVLKSALVVGPQATDDPISRTLEDTGTERLEGDTEMKGDGKDKALETTMANLKKRYGEASTRILCEPLSMLW